MRRLSFAVVAAIALVAPQAANAELDKFAALDADYTHTTAGLGASNTFSGGGSALLAYDRFNFQFDASDARSGSGRTASTTAVFDGDFFWRGREGTFGVSVGRSLFHAGSHNANATGYGLFGEWYATHNLTLALKGGAVSGFDSGRYGDIDARLYILPNLAVHTGYNYTAVSGASTSDFGVGIEYLLARQAPLSLVAAYDHASRNGGGLSINTFNVGFRYRFGVTGILVNLDRTGPIAWNGLPQP
ncbi:MAG TPA: hypothetical protein VGT78_01095 [Rhizomicrobium sp.]|nr:hypothetical protein [Rhizomicrobium sp.]